MKHILSRIVLPLVRLVPWLFLKGPFKEQPELFMKFLTVLGRTSDQRKSTTNTPVHVNSKRGICFKNTISFQRPFCSGEPLAVLNLMLLFMYYIRVC